LLDFTVLNYLIRYAAQVLKEYISYWDSLGPRPIRQMKLFHKSVNDAPRTRYGYYKSARQTIHVEVTPYSYNPSVIISRMNGI